MVHRTGTYRNEPTPTVPDTSNLTNRVPDPRSRTGMYRELCGYGLKNDGDPGLSTSKPFEDDIEAEVNSYFHQMFSAQLTVDAMIQMLARYQESSEKRLLSDTINTLYLY